MLKHLSKKLSEDFDNKIQEFLKKENIYKDIFLLAFLQEYKCKPSEAELIIQYDPSTLTQKISFRRKSEYANKTRNY
jgi:hypothetical protein